MKRDYDHKLEVASREHADKLLASTKDFEAKFDKLKKDSDARHEV